MPSRHVGIGFSQALLHGLLQSGKAGRATLYTVLASRFCLNSSASSGSNWWRWVAYKAVQQPFAESHQYRKTRSLVTSPAGHAWFRIRSMVLKTISNSNSSFEENSYRALLSIRRRALISPIDAPSKT